jgi:Domain of unknown function (DUF4062)
MTVWLLVALTAAAAMAATWTALGAGWSGIVRAVRRVPPGVLTAGTATAGAAAAAAAANLPPPIAVVVVVSAAAGFSLTWLVVDRAAAAGRRALRRLFPARVPRVFLSHTSELRTLPRARSYVEAAEAAVASAGHAFIDMEYWTASDRRPADHCQEKLRTADVYVAIVGFNYGTALDGGESYTAMEFQTATDLGLPRLVFLLDEARAHHEVLPAKPVDPRQAAFRDRLLHDFGLTVHRSTSPENLEYRLYQALTELKGRRRPSHT